MNRLQDHATLDHHQMIGSDESNLVDLMAHRASFDDRFPRVDDILDRLSFDAQVVERSAAGSR